MIARNMAAKTAVKRTGQPYLRSYAHCSYESKLKKVLRFIPLTDEGTQYDYTGVDAQLGVKLPVVLPDEVAIHVTPSTRHCVNVTVVDVGQLATQTPTFPF